ncbi:MAG: NAD(P)-dependent oxidoreductase [candidate division Zixibacteria bacterium]|nr:NAD(P)-dependent oxidoreductase [candidate division Zixibacteria bacterium]
MDNRIGFIGLGNLGRAIAQRLISQGRELVVWNRTAAKADGLGATVAKSPADVVRQSAVTFLCLFNSDSVETVLSGPDGVLSGDCRGKIVCDITTNHFKTVERFHAIVAAKGGAYLETPVLGSVLPALQGNLIALVSGPLATYEQARPLLEQISRRIFHFEPIGHATRMKLINNVLLGSFMCAIAEATILAEQSGVSKETALDIFGLGAGNSGVLTAKRDVLLKEDFSPTFSAAAIHKDLTYLHDLAKHLSVSDAMASTAREIFSEALRQGAGSQDFSTVYHSLKRSM